MTERIQIVDKNDQPLGYATREEAWEQGLHYRIVRIMVVNEAGEILLQKRSPLKKSYPGRWTDAATGHVDYGETYEIAAHRELQEEIGVKTDLEFLGKFEETSEGKTASAFHGVFKGKISKNTALKVEASEVSEVRWFEPEELKRLVSIRPEDFTPGLRTVVERYL